jgi:signal transduction histidine kinase
MSEIEATPLELDLALENERLRAALRARQDELRACRRRLVDAVHAERRRIERNLHDGAQGRLVSLAMSLRFLESKLPGDAAGARPIAREARQAVTHAIEELRELSQGIYPSVLAERGLGEALAELCQRSAVAVRLDVSLEGRLPAEYEAAVYFLISEALTNAAKHARARLVRVAVCRRERQVVVDVADDGVGGAAGGRGSGLRGIADRVESLRGTLTVSSPEGTGTTIHAEIPSG